MRVGGHRRHGRRCPIATGRRRRSHGRRRRRRRRRHRRRRVLLQRLLVDGRDLRLEGRVIVALGDNGRVKAVFLGKWKE